MDDKTPASPKILVGVAAGKYMDMHDELMNEVRILRASQSESYAAELESITKELHETILTMNDNLAQCGISARLTKTVNKWTKDW